MKTMADHARAYRVRRSDKMARYEAALTRLGSMEAFVSSRAVRLPDDEELIARIDFARQALNLDAKDL